MAQAMARPGDALPGETLEVLVQDAEAEARARALLAGLDARYHRIPFGDIWMRDIAPVFLVDDTGDVANVRFRFNGWGGKYAYGGDTEVARRIQDMLSMPAFSSPLILEGGGIECDGAGLCLTTRDVALNENRNPGLSQDAADAALCDALGCSRVVWLERGLLNDHTDGHIDNIARIIGEGRVLCMRPSGSDDPNRDVLAEIEATLRAAGLDVHTIPSPGRVLSRSGEPLPASFLNFYIANNAVVVPVFDSPYDAAALAALRPHFPGRDVVGVPAKVLLEEGGTIHCISQQEPLARVR
jgi:agmatine deiminase